jgi:MFS family permease
MRSPLHLSDDSIFRYREFTLYVSGGWLSSSGTWIQNIVAAVLMFELTHSIFMVGVLNFAAFLPILLFSLIGGVASDRLRRRDLVVVASVISLVLAGLLGVLTLTGVVAPWHLIAVAFSINTAYAFAKPALTSLIPDLVPRHRIPQASAINSMQFTGGQIVGSSIGAVALALNNPGIGFVLNALTYLGPMTAMLLIPQSARLNVNRPKGSGFGAVLEGLQYVKRDPVIIFIVVALAMSSMTAEAMRTLSPAFAADVFGADESLTGVIVGAYGVGSAVSLLSISWLLRWVRPGRLSFAGFLIEGVGVMVFALAPSVPVALLGSALIGMGLAYNLPMLTARLVDYPPAEMRGRVVSLHTMGNLGTRPLASLTAGAIASQVGPPLAMLAFLVAIGVGIFAVRGRHDIPAPRSARIPEVGEVGESAL